MELIWGIQLEEVILLLRQLGLAVAGAASLWGFVLSMRDSKRQDPENCIASDWLSMRVFYLILGGTALAAVSYFALASAIYAHEGISVPAAASEVVATFPAMTTLFVFLIALVSGMSMLWMYNERRFSHLITPFYAATFVACFIMTSLSAWRGALDSVQVFHFMHGFHSIFTLGSVIVLDFLFLISSRSELLKQHVYALFPTISKVIWAGLALDFASVFLIASTFVPTEKFLFVQTVIAVLIINGALLSGPIARRMTSAVETGGQAERKWRRAGNVAGALSITSWLTITALDFFRGLTLGYGELALAYLSIFALALIGHFIFETWEERQAAPALV